MGPGGVCTGKGVGPRRLAAVSVCRRDGPGDVEGPRGAGRGLGRGMYLSSAQCLITYNAGGVIAKTVDLESAALKL